MLKRRKEQDYYLNTEIVLRVLSEDLSGKWERKVPNYLYNRLKSKNSNFNNPTKNVIELTPGTVVLTANRVQSIIPSLSIKQAECLIKRMVEIGKIVKCEGLSINGRLRLNVYNVKDKSFTERLNINLFHANRERNANSLISNGVIENEEVLHKEEKKAEQKVSAISTSCNKDIVGDSVTSCSLSPMASAAVSCVRKQFDSCNLDNCYYIVTEYSGVKDLTYKENELLLDARHLIKQIKAGY